ncbi:MAG TPA: hypothetical protein VHC43_12070 [Mycobacteriales bacterium]|nr:hypothetical protein [Mycobacteriales bacterium]
MELTDSTRELQRWQKSRKLRFPSPRIVIGAAAAAVAGVVIAVVLIVHGGSPSRPTPAGPKHPVSTTLTRLTHLQRVKGVAVLDGPGLAETSAFNAIWVANQQPGQIERVSEDGAHVLSNLSLPGKYVSPIDSGTPGYNPFYYGPQQSGSVMLVSVHGAKAHDGYLVFDKSGRIVGFHPVETAGVIAAGPAGAWVQTSPTSMTRTDSQGALTGAAVQVPGATTQQRIISAAQAGGYLWVTLDGSVPPWKLVKMNATTGAVLGTATLPGAPYAVVATPDAAYVDGQDYRLYRVDGQSLQVTATVLNDLPDASYVQASTGPDGSVWAVVKNGEVVQLDPQTLRTLASWRLHQTVNSTFGALVTSTRVVVNDESIKRLISFSR